MPQINDAAKECIKKLNVEFQTKMSDDLQTPVILTGALQEALKFVNSSLKMLKVFYSVQVFVCLVLTCVSVIYEIYCVFWLAEKDAEKSTIAIGSIPIGS